MVPPWLKFRAGGTWSSHHVTQKVRSIYFRNDNGATYLAIIMSGTLFSC
jgi:hypothetical protein